MLHQNVLISAILLLIPAVGNMIAAFTMSASSPRVAVVTGASRGIGRGIALGLDD